MSSPLVALLEAPEALRFALPLLLFFDDDLEEELEDDFVEDFARDFVFEEAFFADFLALVVLALAFDFVDLAAFDVFDFARVFALAFDLDLPPVDLPAAFFSAI